MSEYILAYSLGTVEGVKTSLHARRAFKEALRGGGWKNTHADEYGVERGLPETTVVGDFPSPTAAKAALAAAKKAGEEAKPGPFLLSRHVLSHFHLVSLTGPLATKGSATTAKPLVESQALRRLRIAKGE